MGSLLNSRWPQRILALPWRIILLVAAIGGFAVVVLYSAAGGSMQPWALNHAVRLSLFMGLAIVLAQVPLGFWLKIAYPLYAAVLVALIGVKACNPRSMVRCTGLPGVSGLVSSSAMMRPRAFTSTRRAPGLPRSSASFDRSTPSLPMRNPGSM